MRPSPRDGEPALRLEAGDARTLAALYDRHADAIYSLAMRITGEPADAEAIVRGVFTAAWSQAERHPGRPAPGAQRVLAAARIRAIDHVRASRATGQAAPPAAETAGRDAPPSDGDAGGARPGDVATLHVPDPAQGPSTGDSPSEEAPRLRAAFRGLPPLERLALELAYFEGLTISQIAAGLEQAAETANARIRSGLDRLAGRTPAGPRTSEPRPDMPPTRNLAGLYALGALNASERAAFEAHLEVHRESVDEVLSLLPVARGLALAVSPHEAPAELRARVIESVTGAPLPDPVDNGGRSEPVDAGGGAEPADEAGSAAHAAGAGKRPTLLETTAPLAPTPPLEERKQPASKPTEQEPTPAMPKPTPGAQKKGGRWALLSLAAGSLVVAGGLGLFAARQANLAAALQENLDAANTQARIAELETAAAQRVADGLRGGARVLTASDVQPLDLDGQPVAPDARGRLFWSTTEGGLLTATGLPPVPPGRVYQLWLIPDASPLSAAILSADAEGRVMAAVTPPEGVTGPVPAAVTLEPAGGAATPGGEVYLLGRP
ncbi:MAG: anti-sigma factor [Acidobacteria bacterium]|nr:anti-sigma factor [Acidobacteriota bacterium]